MVAQTSPGYTGGIHRRSIPSHGIHPKSPLQTSRSTTATGTSRAPIECRLLGAPWSTATYAATEQQHDFTRNKQHKKRPSESTKDKYRSTATNSTIRRSKKQKNVVDASPATSSC